MEEDASREMPAMNGDASQEMPAMEDEEESANPAQHGKIWARLVRGEGVVRGGGKSFEGVCV